MKPRFISQIRLNVILGIGLLLAGCAQFQHQTGEAEPHALVTIVKPGNSPGHQGMVKKLDGLPVSAGQSYRVKPGTHAVLVEFVESVVESAESARMTLFSAGNMPPELEQPANVHLSQSGGMSVTGQQPFAVMQPVNLSVENRRTRTTTQSISVKAGWHYELNGKLVTEKPIAAR